MGALDDVPDDMVEEHPEGYLVMRQREDGSCVALVEGACSIYERRPNECREFYRGSPDCLRLAFRLRRPQWRAAPSALPAA